MTLNPFYQQALHRAGKFFGRNERIVLLISQISTRLTRVKRDDLSFAPIREKISVLQRLVKTYSKGEYRNIPWKPVASILAAFIYFVNPLDLIPDFTPIVGFTDDFSILVWVYTSLQSEIDKFLEWEKSQTVVK